MDDKFTAEEARIRIGVRAVIRVAVRAFLGFIRGVKSVGRRVCADETLARAHIIKQCMLAGRSHRRIFIRALAAQIASRVKKHRVKLIQIFRAELGAILGKGKFPAVFCAELEQNFFCKTGLAVLPRDDGMLKAARLGEEQNFLRRGRGGKSDDEEQREQGNEPVEF